MIYANGFLLTLAATTLFLKYLSADKVRDFKRNPNCSCVAAVVAALFWPVFWAAVILVFIKSIRRS